MNFEEHAAQPFLARRGIAIPGGGLAKTPHEAAGVTVLDTPSNVGVALKAGLGR